MINIRIKQWKSGESILKTEEIEIFKEGLLEEVSIYNEILSISKKEEELLHTSAPVKQVFEYIPVKMKLLEKIGSLDEKLKKLKEEWSVLKSEGSELPHDIIELLKNVETILQEIIVLDENNKDAIVNMYRGGFFDNTPKNNHKQNVKVAIKAYGGKI